MRKQYHKLLYALVPLLSICAIAMGNIFAASEPYNIAYSGGSELKNVVIENESLINSFTPLVARSEGVTITPTGNKWIGTSSSNKRWKKPNSTVGCESTYALEFSYNDITNVINQGYKVSGTYYDMYVTFKDVKFSGFSSAADKSKNFTITIVPGSATLGVGYQLYNDAACTNKVGDYTHLDTEDTYKIFIETEIVLKKRNQATNFSAEGIYFRLSDIDAAQSYKILNSGNELTAKDGSGNGKMYAKSLSALSPSSGSLKNMFNDGYVYSQYSGANYVNCQADETNGCTDANIYVPLTTTTQSNGLQFVFGFANAAGSGIEFFAKQLKVNYASDTNGRITGIVSEDVISGSHPTGSTQEPSTGYEFKCWTADVDVTLSSNNAVIPSGNCMTDAQVEDVKILEDTTFTAIHQAIPAPTQLTVNYASDGYGRITGKTTESVQENGNPTGSTQEPNDGYRFTCWKANVAVTLTSGESKAANTCLTDAEVKKVIVTQAITFTAYHEAIPVPTQLTVNYASDGYGRITGKTTESVQENGNPTGSTQEPNDGYRFTCWKANVAVTLTSGESKAANTCLTDAEVKKVIVTQAITFTAYHEAIPTPTPTQYNVTYISDENGEITGINSETVEENNNPSGSTQKPNDGYEFVCWVANVAVTLTDGETKKVDDCLTDAEVKKVVVTQDIEFTALHLAIPADEEPEEESYPMATPETGASTGEINAVVLPVSVLSIISVVIISILPRLFHKKVSFKK